MRDFEASTLWRVSEYDRVRLRDGGSAFMRLGDASVLSTTLSADLRGLESDPLLVDPLDVVASCIRNREPALVCLRYEGLVWPITLFPNEALYHSPRDLGEADPAALGRLTLLNAEPPGVRPPGHWLHERVAHAEHYRPLAPLLWALSILGPRAYLLDEIAGTAAYRALRDPNDDGGVLRGGLRSAVDRLRRETVALRDIAGWPGMSVERGSRLLNGLYLNSALLATRAHPAARPAPRALGFRSRR